MKKTNEQEILLDKQKGMLYGLYAGDILGGPLEFLTLDGVDPITRYTYGGVHHLKLGQFTDDTSMTLALMHSLTEKGFDQKDQMDKYIKWMLGGEYSSKGFCFDIGIATQRALNYYKMTTIVEAGVKDNYSSGNGSLMRLAPVSLWAYPMGLDKMIHYAKASSVTTHGSHIVLDTLAYFSSIIFKILNGEKNKDEILKADIDALNITNNVVIEDLINADFLGNEKYDMNPTGFIINSLICAIWAFYNTDSFEDALIKAVNIGGTEQADADTIGAITGQIAGAYYGFKSIPSHFIDEIFKKDMVDGFTNAFLETLNK